jgi:dipeptidyl-peptidase-4
MKKIVFAFLLFFYCTNLFAQRGGQIKWNNTGDAYYAIEKNDIVKYSLPTFEKIILSDKKNLLLEDKKTELSIKNFFVSNDENVFLLFTNTVKVWRYETRGDYFIYNKKNW